MSFYIIIILTWFCSSALLAESKLAIINEPDGYVSVRSGSDNSFQVIDTLFACDLFFVRIDELLDWACVTELNGKQVEGYILKSKIQEVEKLETNFKKVLIAKTLERHRELATEFHFALKLKDSLALSKVFWELEIDNDAKYDPILSILPKYFCLTKDTTILQLFISTILADKGSANEMPSFTIGECFICKPDMLVEQINQISDQAQRETIFDSIEWGLRNYFDANEKGESENKEFKRLMILLNEGIKKNHR